MAGFVEQRIGDTDEQEDAGSKAGKYFQHGDIRRVLFFNAPMCCCSKTRPLYLERILLAIGLGEQLHSVSAAGPC